MDLVLSGVGGQGMVLASRVIGECAMERDMEVRTSEIIGMAQREGSVMSQVRIGHNLYGGLIPDAKADILLGFELAEAVRACGKLKSGGTAIINTQTIIPPTVYLGMSKYEPQELIDALSGMDFTCHFIEAHRLARQAGNPQAVSAVMLGAFSKFSSPWLEGEELLEMMLRSLPEKVNDINRRAFFLGREQAGL